MHVHHEWRLLLPFLSQEQSEEKDRQLAAAEEAKIKAEEEFKSELEDFRTHPHGLTVHNHLFGTSSILCIHDVVNCSRYFDWYLSTLDVSQSTGETGLLQGVYDCFLHLGTWICPILTVLTAKKTLDIMIIFRKAYVRLCWAYSYYTNVFVNYLLNLKNLRLILVTT